MLTKIIEFLARQSRARHHLTFLMAAVGGVLGFESADRRRFPTMTKRASPGR